MLATSRPDDVLACPQCRLRFSSRSALRRHRALDHSPAPDGADLVAQIVGAPQPAEPSAPEPAGDAVPHPPADAAARRAARQPWGPVLVLLAIALLTAGLGPLGLVPAVVVSLHVARRLVLRRLDDSGSSSSDRDVPAA